MATTTVLPAGRARLDRTDAPGPGLAEHALPLKALGDAVALRNHVLRRLETAEADQSDAANRRPDPLSFRGGDRAWSCHGVAPAA